MRLGTYYTIKQCGNHNDNYEVDRIISINLHSREQALPFINVVNPHPEYVGQFLLDTESERNLIKINSLPADCEITSDNCIFLKGINGDIFPTLGHAEITVFEYTAKFQIVPGDFPIPSEGLLGAEYFEGSRAVLDFGINFLRIDEKHSLFRDRKPTFKQNLL